MYIQLGPATTEEQIATVKEYAEVHYEKGWDLVLEVMSYQTYEISLTCKGGLKFLQVVACDLQAAYADVREAYGQDVDIVGARLV